MGVGAVAVVVVVVGVSVAAFVQAVLVEALL